MDLVEGAGRELLYLTLCSPDLGPIIEQPFSRVTGLVRKKAGSPKALLEVGVRGSMRSSFEAHRLP